MRANLIISCISIPLLYWLVHTLLLWPQLCTCHPPCLSLSWCLSLRCLLSSNVSKCQAKRWELYKKKEEREQLKWKAAGHVGLDLQIKKASEQAKQFSPLLPPCLPRLPSPSFTLLSPWTADWHSVEDSPGWRLKEVKLICELKRECSRGHRVEGVGMCWW